MGDGRIEIRISVVSDDWANEGCHVHVGEVEVAVRPTHLGGLVIRSVFARDNVKTVEAAGTLVIHKIEDPTDRFLEQVTEAVERAMEYLPGIRGGTYALARGRLAELSRLRRILRAIAEERS